MSTLKANNVANTSGGPARSMDDIVGATPRAWVNFNGTGTVAIRAAYNVSSITDNGSGDYTLNFTSNLPDSNYAFNITAMDNGTNFTTIGNNANYSSTVSSLRFGVRNAVGALSDIAVICAAVFR